MPAPTLWRLLLSSYLYRLARFAFRRRRLVLALWLIAAVAAIALARPVAVRRMTTSRSPHRGAERVERPDGQAAGVQRWPEHDRLRHHQRQRQGDRCRGQGGDRVGLTKIKSVPQVSSSPIRSRAIWCHRAARLHSGRCSGRQGNRCEGRQPRCRQGRREAGAGRRRTGRVQRQRLPGLRTAPSRRPSWSA